MVENLEEKEQGLFANKSKPHSTILFVIELCVIIDVVMDSGTYLRTHMFLRFLVVDKLHKTHLQNVAILPRLATTIIIQLSVQPSHSISHLSLPPWDQVKRGKSNLPLKMPLKGIQLQSCFVETVPTLAEALLSKTYVLGADGPISLEEKVYSYGAIHGIKDSINTEDCVKYIVEGQVIVNHISKPSMAFLYKQYFRKKLDS